MSTASGKSGSLVMQVVTCRKSPPERQASAVDQLEQLGLPLETQIVDGFIADDDVADTLYDPATNRRRAKRPISRSEICVYASHRLAWQRLLESRHSAALVLEDDFALRDRETVAAVLDDWQAVLSGGRDIVKLFDFERRVANRPAFTHRVGTVELVKWHAPTAGMVAYLISREGAEKLLSRERVFRQIDEDIKYFWELGLNVWSVPGNPVTEISHALGGSLIENDRERAKTRHLLRSLWGNLLTADRKLRTRVYITLEKLAGD